MRLLLLLLLDLPLFSAMVEMMLCALTPPAGMQILTTLYGLSQPNRCIVGEGCFLGDASHGESFGLGAYKQGFIR